MTTYFFSVGGRVSQQTIIVPIGTNSAPLLSNLFLYSNEAYLKRKLIKTSDKKQDRSFNFTFRNIDVVLSLNSYKFVDFVDRIYSIDHEIKDTIPARSDS